MKKFAAALVLAAICVAPTGAFAAGKHYRSAPCGAPACAPVCAPVCAPACPAPCNDCCFNPLGIVGGVVSGVGDVISGIGCGISNLFSCGGGCY